VLKTNRDEGTTNGGYCVKFAMTRVIFAFQLDPRQSEWTF
jgi:hypothetical protein